MEPTQVLDSPFRQSPVSTTYFLGSRPLQLPSHPVRQPSIARRRHTRTFIACCCFRDRANGSRSFGRTSVVVVVLFRSKSRLAICTSPVPDYSGDCRWQKRNKLFSVSQQPWGKTENQEKWTPFEIFATEWSRIVSWATRQQPNRLFNSRRVFRVPGWCAAVDVYGPSPYVGRVGLKL